MTELLTAAQMRAIEAAAIASGEVTGLELMERAGAGVVEAVFEEWPELGEGSHKAVVLCGPGNNGGDGFVVARLLKQAGWEVEVFLYGDAAKLPPDAKANCERWGEMGEVKDALEIWRQDMKDQEGCTILTDQNLIVDAIFGTGLKRAFPEELEHFSRSSDHREIDAFKVVSVDIPSGLCSDSGKTLVTGSGVPTMEAGLTVSFHSLKVGHFLSEGPILCGKLAIVDIGLCRCWEQTVRIVKQSQNTRKKMGHKFTHGHALILSGPSGKGGAARLAARGALRIGAGVVSVGCPGEALAENAAQLDAIMLAAIHDGDALARVLQDTRINALCLGPGLGLERARELVPVAVRAEHTPYVVLDADALTAFEDAPGVLFDLLHERCVLTPHAGEFGRLFPDIAAKLAAVPTKGPAYSKVDATREAAKRAGCVVLYKGADTVIADPDGRCSINSAAYARAAPWLATAGSGDVLAGFITGLLARGFPPMQAAETAAWLHVECALSFGPGLIAEDIPEELPKVFRALEV